MLFALWLLSQALGFALAALPSVAERDVPLQAAWAQNHGGSHGYDAGSQSRVAHDAELPSATTEGFGDFVAIAPIAPRYDLFSLVTISVVGAPSAPPAENAEFLAAKGANGLPLGPGAMNADELAAMVRAAGKYDAGPLGSAEDALALARKAFPDAVELPPAIPGQPYPSPPQGVKQWFQLHPAEPGGERTAACEVFRLDVWEEGIWRQLGTHIL